jgi:hypothetical protein
MRDAATNPIRGWFQMSASDVATFALRGIATCGMAAGSVFLTAAVGAPAARAQSNPCAIYGAGFVPVHGGGSCVRIGGRVRVDVLRDAPHDALQSGALNFAAPAPSPLDGPDRTHLRLYVGPQTGMPRTR